MLSAANIIKEELPGELLLTINPDGSIDAIASDAKDGLLLALAAEGDAIIERASHVEPVGLGQWEADLAPVGGPKLAGFSRREDALKAEVAWLEEHFLA